MDIGFIGLGRMGSLMCGHLHAPGNTLHVYDVRSSATADQVARGAHVAQSPAEVAARSDVTILMVNDAQQTRDAVFGDDGYAQGASNASLLIVMSSLTPEVIVEIQNRFGDRGPHLLDAPVSGGIEGAAAGTLTVMVGGSDADFLRVQPVLQRFSHRLIQMGAAPGQGQATKLLNQAMYFSNLAVSAEATIAASRMGIDVDRFVDAVASSSGDSWSLRNRTPLAWRNDYRSGGSLAVAQKDLRAATDLARSYDMSLALIEAVRCLYEAAGNISAKNADDPEIVRALEKLTGHSIPPT